MELVQIKGIVASQLMFCPLLHPNLETVPLLVWADLGTCEERVARWSFGERETTDSACRCVRAVSVLPRSLTCLTLHKCWMN